MKMKKHIYTATIGLGFWLLVPLLAIGNNEVRGRGAESTGAEPARRADDGGGNFRSQRGGGGRTGDGGDIRRLAESFNLNDAFFAWRGSRFNLGDVEAARARFDRYLSTPPALSEEDLEYSKLMETINRRLIGEGGGTETQRLAESWRMLYEASAYPMDNGLSETLADRIISFWQTNDRIHALLRENERIEQDRERTEGRLRTIGSRDRREFIDMMRNRHGREIGGPPSLDYEREPHEKRLVEMEARMQENRRFEEMTRANQKLEFQSLIVQFFVQRRFQHALIANTFYRYMFSGEDNSLEEAGALQSQVFGDLEVRLTTSTLDALAKEAIAEVEETIKAVEYHMSRGETHTATRRLMEAFYLGEYLPPVKTFPIEYKEHSQKFLRDLDRLAAALEVRNFDRAEGLLAEIDNYSRDFDTGPADSYITTTKRLSDLAVQRAAMAAAVSDREGVEVALEEAVRAWPTNPEIKAFTTRLMREVDIQDVAAVDFDRFVRQNDFRAVFNDRFRFAAALAQDPVRNEAFLDIMKRMEAIEAAIAQSLELQRLRNHYGAWEILERIYLRYPEDQSVNRLRGDYAARASDLAAVLANARDAVEDGDPVRALIGYMRARDLYPASYFAQKGMESLSGSLLGGVGEQGKIVVAHQDEATGEGDH